MTEEIRITYMGRQGTTLNYPTYDLVFPTDARGAPCNNCDEWFLERDLSETAGIICPRDGPKVTQSIRKDYYQC